ncbi:transcription termination factor 3, mitochondrial isoform X1 [Octopus sinensis]|uniref:Transcription termination factor 3, mitochondrial isoform X1 n=1 Tax=Octopus sinensis TaxID=2607531 RepID=A0A6P7S8F8_9MOLL|nr:transcription termination factor 3, mitochondrial isoform X1 [Octopus sinensis]
MLLKPFLQTFRQHQTLLLSSLQHVRAKECLSLVCRYCHQKTAEVNTGKYENSKPVEDENSNQLSSNNYEYFKSFIETAAEKKLQNFPHSAPLIYDKGHFPDGKQSSTLAAAATEIDEQKNLSKTTDFFEKQRNVLKPPEKSSLPQNETTVEHYPNDSSIDKESDTEQPDAKLPSVTKPSTVYRPMFIREEPVYNLAFYVKESKTLQRLVQLGVDLSHVEKVKGASDHILKQDFDSNIQPYLNFLMSNGVSEKDLGNCITKNPLLFQIDVNSLEANISYLQSKNFSFDGIGRIITIAPRFLLMSVSALDGKLGYYQNFFKLAGNQIREVICQQPKLITYDVKAIKAIHFEMKEFLGFTNSDLQKIFLLAPKVYFSNKYLLTNKFEYLHHEMGLNHVQLVQWPGIFRTRLFKIKERHQFLKHLKRNQYDPCKENYVSLKALVTKTDKEFCTTVAKSSAAEFNQFLKTL